MAEEQKHQPSYHFWGPPRAPRKEKEEDAVHRAIHGDVRRADELLSPDEWNTHLRVWTVTVHRLMDLNESFRARENFASTPRSEMITTAVLQTGGTNMDLVSMYELFTRTLEEALEANLSFQDISQLFWLPTDMFDAGRNWLKELYEHDMRPFESLALELVVLAVMLPFGSNPEHSVDLFRRLCEFEEVRLMFANLNSVRILDNVAFPLLHLLARPARVSSEVPGLLAREKAKAKWDWMLLHIVPNQQTRGNLHELDVSHRRAAAAKLAYNLQDDTMMTRIFAFVGLTPGLEMVYALLDYVCYDISRRGQLQWGGHLERFKLFAWMAERIPFRWVYFSVIKWLCNIPLEFEYIQALKLRQMSPKQVREDWSKGPRPQVMKILAPLMDVILTRKNWRLEDNNGPPMFPDPALSMFESNYRPPPDATEQETERMHRILKGMAELAMDEGIPFYRDYVIQRVREAKASFDALRTGELDDTQKDVLTSLDATGLPRELMAEVGSYLFDLPGEERKEGHSDMGRQLLKGVDAVRRRIREEAESVVAAYALAKRMQSKRSSRAAQLEESEGKRLKMPDLASLSLVESKEEEEKEEEQKMRPKRSAGEADLPDLSGLRIGPRPAAAEVSSSRTSRMGMTAEEELKRIRMADAAAARMRRYLPERPQPATVAEEREEGSKRSKLGKRMMFL